MDMARELVSAPPVAVARLLSFTVKKDGKTISDKARLAKRIKCISLTNMRFWGDKNEMLEVRIDLNRSYDLQHRKLSFKCLALYPKLVKILLDELSIGLHQLSGIIPRSKTHERYRKRIKAAAKIQDRFRLASDRKNSLIDFPVERQPLSRRDVQFQHVFMPIQII